MPDSFSSDNFILPTPGEMQRGKHLLEHQLDAIAKLAALGGNSPERIAVTLNIPPKRIEKLLRGGANEKFDKLYGGYQKEMMSQFHGAVFNLVERLPRVHEVFDEALSSKNVAEKTSMAKWIYEKVHPVASTKQVENLQDNSTNVFINQNPEARQQLSDTVQTVGTVLGELKTYISRPPGPNHELIGVEALPIPPGQLEVTDGEALPEVFESDETLKLIELDEFTERR